MSLDITSWFSGIGFTSFFAILDQQDAFSNFLALEGKKTVAKKLEKAFYWSRIAKKEVKSMPENQEVISRDNIIVSEHVLKCFYFLCKIRIEIRRNFRK